MPVVLLLHPKINCMTIPPCGNFSNHISPTFLNLSFHCSKLNDVYNGMIISPSNRGHVTISIHKKNELNKKCVFFLLISSSNAHK